MAPTTTLVPPRRLGTLLRQAREASGRELTDLTVRSRLSVVELDDIEHGRRQLDEATMQALVEAYGIDASSLVPARSQLTIDLDDGRVAIEKSDIDVDASYGADAVLIRYLALVYRLRDLPLGTRLPLRDIDIEVLSGALSLGSGDVESRLYRLMSAGSDIAADQRRIRRQLLMPLVGVIVAATGVGTLVLVAGEPNTPPEGPDVVEVGAVGIEQDFSVPTNLGTGGAVEINPEG